MASLYETDFYAWTQEESAKLRDALTTRGDLGFDFENLAEEIDSLGRRDVRTLTERLTEIVDHLLKLAFSLSWEPRRQWRLTVDGHRYGVRRLLDECPSLAAMLPSLLAEAYEDALKHFDDEKLISLTMPVLPAKCPFAVDHAIMVGWWPDPRGEA